MTDKIIWPEGKDFAFTIFDDTDYAYKEKVADVYKFLFEFGFRTTKSVWTLKGKDKPLCEGATCDDKEYLQWLWELKKQGFEIGYHMATYHTSKRKDTIEGLSRFKQLFDDYPKTMANHSGCKENIYWGSNRLTGFNRLIYNLLTRYQYNKIYCGHIESNELFWGDLCLETIKYVRNFVFSDINTLKMCPYMPYHDNDRPYVNYWFASSEGPEVNSFNKTISKENQDRLEQEGGCCIMYSHLACGFYENGKLNTYFKELMTRLSKKNGWFVPVGTLLDFLREYKGNPSIAKKQRKQLERNWLKHKIKVGHT